MKTNEFREQWIAMILDLQDRICAALEQADGEAKFKEDCWERNGGGGGRTRVITGKVLEKGGVNTSTVWGDVTDTMRRQLQIEGDHWFACGISLVIHPFSPLIPTTHLNYRMFEMYDAPGNLTDRWFGGGTDLTPYYLNIAEARHFHQTYKNICDQADPAFYAEFKKTCDDYFVNTHRGNERRGIGGIFYDHKRPDAHHPSTFWLNFAQQCGLGFIDAYIPLIEAHKHEPFTAAEKYWQEIRRGRYVEFNLVHDRGTLFGLKTNGRTESILMSLPPTVRFDYAHQPAVNSPEAELLDACLHPREWIEQN